MNQLFQNTPQVIQPNCGWIQESLLPLERSVQRHSWSSLTQSQQAHPVALSISWSFFSSTSSTCCLCTCASQQPDKISNPSGTIRIIPLRSSPPQHVTQVAEDHLITKVSEFFPSPSEETSCLLCNLFRVHVIPYVSGHSVAC